MSEIDKNTFNLLPTLENFLTENNMNNIEELASDIIYHCCLLINIISKKIWKTKTQIFQNVFHVNKKKPKALSLQTKK